ncbi:MAG: SGNH/GDSL hydrolase family protein [Lentisphaerae bacterium]|nr:SGNH/GDSL hydrolase family protein [Lentisphaerota bacterium]
MVGDSITRSYYDPVATALQDKYHSARLTTSTAVADHIFNKELALLIDDYPFAIIHFNNGLHGWDYSESTYAAGLTNALDFITSHSPQSRIVLATSTPVRDKNNLQQFDPVNERVIKRNQLMLEIASSRGIAINDLYSGIVNHPNYYQTDGVHLNATGIQTLTRQVLFALCAATRDFDELRSIYS